MKKRITALLLTLCLAVCMVACGMQRTEDKETQPLINTVQTSVPTEETTVPTTAPTNPTEETTAPTTPTLPQKKVDIAKLHSIEKNDTFAVKMTDMQLIDNYFTIADGVSINGYDAIGVTMQNNTGKKITNISFLVLATDSNGKDVAFAGMTPITAVGEVQNYSKCVSLMTGGETEIANGESKNYVIRCSLSQFANVNIIVYSYTDAEGNEIINESCYEWLGNTLAVEVK